MDVVIYRYEAKDGNGPYNTARVHINSIWDADPSDTPQPYEWKKNKDDVFGFLSRIQARRWFNREMRREMRCKGVRLRVYRAPVDAIAYSDGHQVAVNVKQAKQLV